MSSPKVHSAVALLTCLLILVFVNLSIAGKEQHLAAGRVVYLDLAPVDPRSLMQGDYMALNFAVATEANRRLPRDLESDGLLGSFGPGDGNMVVALDERSIGSFVRIDDDQDLAENEIAMRYRIRNDRLKFATNGYFFKEGTAELYEDARYGKFRVDEKGELLLTHLCDENLQELGGG